MTRPSTLAVVLAIIAAVIAVAVFVVLVNPPPQVLWVRVPPPGKLLIDVRREPGGRELTRFTIEFDREEGHRPKPAPRAIVLERGRWCGVAFLCQLGVEDARYSRPIPPVTVRSDGMEWWRYDRE